MNTPLTLSLPSTQPNGSSYATQTQALRRAALKLHTLHPQDRDWLLNQLPTPQQSTLRNLITELQRLGFPNDPRLLEDQALPPVVQNNRYELAADTLITIDQAGAATIQKIWDAQSEKVQAMLLSAHHWSWSTALWAKLETHQRGRLIKLLQPYQPTNETFNPQQKLLIQTLLNCLAEELRNQSQGWAAYQAFGQDS